MARTAVTNFNKKGMNIDMDSLRNLVGAQTKNMFTGVMDLRTNTIYFAPLQKPPRPEDDHYGTIAPSPEQLHRFPCKVLGTVIDPILHKVTDPTDRDKQITSHDQLAQKVILLLRNGSADDFCGFALRFEEGKKVMLAPTSRTLNPGYNGQLEEPILNAILAFLKPKLGLLGFDLEIAAARISPDVAQANRGGALIPRGLLGGIQGGFALKPTGKK